jgi:F0F1-type ATP synthase delta subunit
MIKTLTSAALKDLVSYLKSNPDFMGMSEEQRAQKAPAMASMVQSMDDAALLEDLKMTVKVIKGAALAADSKISQAMGRYFVIDFPKAFDQMTTEFYSLSAEQQMQKLDELFPEKAEYFRALKQILMVESPQEITEYIVQFLTDVFSSPRILVQSPMECELETKTSIRSHYAKEYPQSFVAFSVNPQLIGGIRFFVDGDVVDHSWFARIGDIRRLRDVVS